MNKLYFTLSLIAATGTAMAAFSAPAMADNYSQYSNGQLPKVTWPKMRPEIRVSDTTPIVHYDTPAEKQPIYLIPTGLPQAKAAPVVVLPGPGQVGGAGGGITVPPGFAAIDPNQPSPARFGSNIPANGMSPAQNLPDGTNSNHLMGRMKGIPKGMSTAAPVLTAPARILPAVDGIPKTMMYANDRSSGTGGGTNTAQVKTSVNATLTKRFDLIKK